MFETFDNNSTKDKSHDAYTEPPNVTQTMDCLKTPPSCASVDSGINLSRINSANSRGMSASINCHLFGGLIRTK